MQEIYPSFKTVCYIIYNLLLNIEQLFDLKEIIKHIVLFYFVSFHKVISSHNR